MAAHDNKDLKPHEKKQASVLISITGVIGFTVCQSIALVKDTTLPLYVLCIFAAIVVPPELAKRIATAILRGFVGGKDDN